MEYKRTSTKNQNFNYKHCDDVNVPGMPIIIFQTICQCQHIDGIYVRGVQYIQWSIVAATQ